MSEISNPDRLLEAADAIETLERRLEVVVLEAKGDIETLSNMCDRLVRQSNEQCDTIEALERERDAAFEEGVKSVLYIRCMEHREVPQYNRNEIRGGECPACAMDALLARVAKLEAVAELMRVFYDYEGWSPAGHALAKDALAALDAEESEAK